MKIITSKKLLVVLALVINLPLLSAQTVIATLEAEAGTLTLPAKVKNVNGYSRNAYVGDNDPGSSITFNNVEIAQEGTYEIKTYYSSMQLRSIAVKSNDFPDAISTITTATQDWNAPPTGTMSTYIYLNKGVNTIKISPYPTGQGAPNMDKFEILTTDITIPKPGTFPILLEAETARLFGDLKIKPIDGTTKPGLSGGKYIGDFNLSTKSYLQFVDVQIPEEGTYELKIFSMGSGRKLAIKVNQYEKLVVTTKNSPDWNNAPTSELSTLIYMDKGRNRIMMSLHNDNGPNLDKFEIHQTNQTIPKPLVEKVSFVSSHADEAEVSAQYSNETLANIIDNSEYSFYKVTGVTSAQITAKCKQPILLTGFLLSAGIEQKADVSQWMVESSVDGTTWKTVIPNGSTDLSGGFLYTVNRSLANAASESAQYYRLTAKGAADVEVAEWQLFGVPYLANTDGKCFPADITEGTDIRSATKAFPAGTSGAGWTEEYYNLFNRKLSQKYFMSGAKQYYVEIQLDKKFQLDSYTLTSADEFPDRDPRRWTLSGYNDETGWTELDRHTEFNFPCRYATMRFDIRNQSGFSKFLLDVEDNNGSADSQLLKWQLFGKEYINSGIKTSPAISCSVWSQPGKINILSQNNNLLVYRIYNPSGILVTKGNLSGTQKSIALVAGVYIVKLTDKKNDYNTKVIVQ